MVQIFINADVAVLLSTKYNYFSLLAFYMEKTNIDKPMLLKIAKKISPRRYEENSLGLK